VTLVQGTVRRAGGRLRVSAHLINAESGYDLWSDEYERDVRDVFAVQDEITRAIVGALRVKLAANGGAPFARPTTTSPEAHDLYLHGRFFYEKRNEEGLRRALVYFRQAIEKDSAYALAYSGLADTYSFLSAFGFETPREMFPKAKVAALQALQLDSTLPESHTSLGFISLFYDWDWPAADREFRRALSLDSTYTPALLYHGWYNVAVGRIDAAVSDLERARAIDPLSLILNTRLGTMLFLARRYDAALTQLSRTLALDSSYDLAHAALARVYIQLRQCDRAQLELHGRTRMVAPYYESSALGYAAGACGHQGEATRTLEQLHAIRQRGQYVSPAVVASIYLGLGDKGARRPYLVHVHPPGRSDARPPPGRSALHAADPARRATLVRSPCLVGALDQLRLAITVAPFVRRARTRFSSCRSKASTASRFTRWVRSTVCSAT